MAKPLASTMLHRRDTCGNHVLRELHVNIDEKAMRRHQHGDVRELLRDLHGHGCGAVRCGMEWGGDVGCGVLEGI